MATGNRWTLVVDDDLKINSVSKGGIEYGDRDAIKYRVYSNGSSGSSADIDISLGNLKFENNYYYNTFVSQKTRSRTVTQTITVNRTFPAVSSTGVDDNDKCCASIWKEMDYVYYKVPWDCPELQKLFRLQQLLILVKIA